MSANFKLINEICTVDAEELEIKEQTYGDSWRQRGGVGAFMMLARKWDRIENQCAKEGYDIFAVLEGRLRIQDGLIDDIRDLRRYLLLVEQYVVDRHNAQAPDRVRSVLSKAGYTACESPEGPDGGYINQ